MLKVELNLMYVNNSLSAQVSIKMAVNISYHVWKAQSFVNAAIIFNCHVDSGKGTVGYNQW